ncbi:hypothetical protein STXM2123_4259 [Streptomyces sp. F-3]|nr:hypothetical protein STXM2123_4259 [Streptomyces sp. F-3]
MTTSVGPYQNSMGDGGASVQTSPDRSHRRRQTAGAGP